MCALRYNVAENEWEEIEDEYEYGIEYLEEREELTGERILEMLEEHQFKELREELETNMYPVDLADELNRIFGELRKNGVKMRVIKVQEPEIPAF